MTNLYDLRNCPFCGGNAGFQSNGEYITAIGIESEANNECID